MSMYSGYQLLTPKKNSTTVQMECNEVSWLNEALAECKPNIDNLTCDMYVLHFYVDFATREFFGDVRIHVNLKTICQHIILDKGRCDVLNVRILKVNDWIDIDQVYDYIPQQVLVISLCRKLIPAKYKIIMAVKGQLSDKPEGFFFIHHSHDRQFALTHLWPDHAKHVFPCFNDPAFESIFIVSLVRPSSRNFLAFSNMSVEKRIADFPNEKLTTVYYIATPPIQVMSLSMVIGNFVVSDPILAKLGYTISIACREEVINRTKEVLDMICTIMSFIGKFNRAQFNLTKIHVIAVPITNFPSYCMSNPGIIVFSERQICSVSDKTCLYYTRVVRKLIHEVIHVWLGRLCVSQSWDLHHIFEGSVGYLSNVIGAQIFPSWFTDWMAIYYDLQTAMDVEPWFGSVMSRAPDNVPPALNSLSAQALFYGKNAALIRMLAVTDFATFRFQVVQYFSHKATLSQRDRIMFDCPDSAIEIPRVAKMLEQWPLLETYPLVSVVVNSTGRVSLHLKGFYRKTDPRHDRNSSSTTYRTLLPIMYFEFEDKKVKTTWFEEEGAPIILQQVLKPFKLNWHQTGYYRVNYTKDLWSDFVKTIQQEKLLDPEDKANLLDDSFTLAEYGHIHHGIPLSLVVYLREGFETHPLPWMTATKYLENIKRRTRGSEITYLLEMFVKLIVEPYLEDEYIWSVVNQPVMEVIRKIAIISLAASFHCKDVIERLKYILSTFMDEGAIPLELKRVTCAFALQDAEIDEPLFDEVLDHFNEEHNALKKAMYWTALAGVRSELHITNLWDMVNDMEESNIDAQFDKLVMMKILSSNPLSHDFLWPELSVNWSSYSSLPDQDKDNIRTILFNIIDYSNDSSFLQEVSEFGMNNEDLDVQHYALKVKDDVARWEPTNYKLFVEEWLHLYIMNSS